MVDRYYAQEQNLDNIILENISNPKTYWKIMKMLIKSNKGCNNIPPLQNIIQDEGLEVIFFAVLRIRSRFLISLLSSLLNHGRSLLRTVTISIGMHSLATLRNVSVKVLHISSTS
jgi:hypothetical protein